MMDPHVPAFISIMFILVTLITLYMVYFAIKVVDENIAKRVLAVIILWLIITGVLATSGFYLEITTKPFRFFLAAPVAVISIILLLLVKRSRDFIKKLSLEILTYISTVRIPVEIVLWWLFLYNQVPGEMTFEGRNFDILAGITAPIVGYFVFTKKIWNIKIGFAWNILSLLLLMNIVAHAFLSFPFPFQQMAFDHPNWGLLYFPYIWLPAFVAPAVLFTHMASILQLIKSDGK